jgi:hypothetical protein
MRTVTLWQPRRIIVIPISLSSLLVPGNFYTFLNPVTLTYFPSCLRSKGGHRKFCLLVRKLQICKFSGSFWNQKSPNFFNVPVCKSQIRKICNYYSANRKFANSLGFPICKLEVRKFSKKKTVFLIQIYIGFSYNIIFYLRKYIYTTKCHAMLTVTKAKSRH